MLKQLVICSLTGHRTGLLFVMITMGYMGSMLSAQQTSLPDTSFFIPGADIQNLHEAVVRQNHSAALLLMNRGLHPDSIHIDESSLLNLAISSGDSLMTRILVLNGASIDSADQMGNTPLVATVLNNQFGLCHYLLGEGCDPDQKDRFGGSALLYASANNNYPICDLLLYYGASDNIRDKDGNSALMTAVCFGNLETADVLLQLGANPDGNDMLGNTPLMVAAQQGNKEMSELLLEKSSAVDSSNKHNYTPLAHAVHYGRDSVALLLLSSGADVNHPIRKGRNLYDLATLNRDKQMIDILENHGASMSQGPDFTIFQLMWGNSYNTNTYMVQIRLALLDHKRNYFFESGIDFSPFYTKVEERESELLSYQYREIRFAWAHGVGKYFRVISVKTADFGFYAGLYGMLSIPARRGFEGLQKPHYSLAPAGGVYVDGEYLGLKMGAEAYRFGTELENTIKMNVCLYLKINKADKYDPRKEISY